jgi:hypothetical protein
MSRTTVRAAITSYFQTGIDTAAITGLATVYPHPPKITPEGDFIVASEDPGHSMGTVMYIYLGKTPRKRLGTGGPTSGIKQALYPVALVCFTRSAAAKSQDCGVQSDAFLDSLVAYIQANRTANSAGVIFQWGESDHFGGDDISVDVTMPRLLGGKLGLTQVYSVVEVLALENYYA